MQTARSGHEPGRLKALALRGIRKTLWMLAVLWGITLVSFFVIHLAPGSPTDMQTSLNPLAGDMVRDRLNALREADAILREEFDKAELAGKVWQYFIAVPDFKSVGVRDGKRYEGWSAIIRAVNTTDAMSATIEEIPYPLLHTITHRITTEVEGINRVLYDLTPKPVATIEWE